MNTVPHIVLDTNCLIMAISSRNDYHLIWQAFLHDDYVLCITNEIVEEYIEVLSRNINPWVAEAIVYTILTRKNVRKLVPYYHFGLIEADPDDNKFVDCAICANARYIVTEDRHFDVLATCTFPKVDVIGIDLFTSMIATRDYHLLDRNNPTLLNEPAVPYETHR